MRTRPVDVREQATDQVTLEEGAALDEGAVRIRRLVSELSSNPVDRDVATRLNATIDDVRRAPSQAVFEALQEIGESRVLAGSVDRADRSCRIAALEAWLELGYPWALQLTPEQLDEVRKSRPSDGSGWISAARGASTASALVNVVFTAVVASRLSLPDPVAIVVWTLPFTAMLLHAVLTLFALRDRDSAPRASGSRLRRLGVFGWIGLGLWAVVASLLPVWGGAGLGLLMAPFLISALVSRRAGAVLLARPPHR